MERDHIVSSYFSAVVSKCNEAVGSAGGTFGVLSAIYTAFRATNS